MIQLNDLSEKRYFSLKSISVVGAFFLISACAPVTPQWDARFGDSVRMAIAQQTLNPDASRNTDPVLGIDGRAASESMNRYHESFKKPPPPPPLFQIMNNSGSGG